MPRWPGRLMIDGLFLVLVGVQISEGIATGGLALTVAGALADAWYRRRSLDWASFFTRWRWLVAFAVWAVFAPFFALHAPSGTGVGRLFDWLALPAMLRAFQIADERQRRHLLWAGAVTLVASALVAGLQHFGAFPDQLTMRRWNILGWNTDRVYEPVRGAFTRVAGLIVCREIPTRFMAGGLAFHRLVFSDVSCLGILFGVAVAMRETGWRRLLAMSIAAFALVAIVAFAYVRAGPAAVLGGAAVVMLLGSTNRRRALAVIGGTFLLVLALVVLIRPVRARFASSLTFAGSGDRPAIWETATHALETSPVVGIGLWRFRVGDWVPPSGPALLQGFGGKAHDQFLTFAVETGIPGALLFILWLLSLGARLDPSTQGGAFGWGALAYFALLSLVHDPLFHATFSMAFVLALAWALASGSRKAARLTRPAPSA